MDTLALTDRDGLYGAVRFAKACAAPASRRSSGSTSPSPVGRGPAAARRGRVTPAKGGELRDARLPRVVTLATSRAGWASLCRLTSAVHLPASAGSPSAPPSTDRRPRRDDLVVMLGPDSDLGPRAGSRPIRTSRSRCSRAGSRWCEPLPAGDRRRPTSSSPAPASGRQPRPDAMLAFADAHGLTGVLTNAVRMAGKHHGPTARRAGRRPPAGAAGPAHTSTAATPRATSSPARRCCAVAEEVSPAGRAGRDADRLLGDTRDLAIRCRLDPRADIGLGEIHLPEFDVLGWRQRRRVPASCGSAARPGMAARYGVAGAARRATGWTTSWP